MLAIPQSKWDQHRHVFSDDEKYELHLATVAESTAGNGFIVDESQLLPLTRVKLRFHLEIEKVFAPRKARAAC